jgi:hypothetical protein
MLSTAKDMSSVIDEWLRMEHWWNDTVNETAMYSDKNLAQCHFFHHTPHTDYPRLEDGPARWEAGD